MKVIKLFNKEDFKPHHLDAEWPILNRIDEGPIGIISVGEHSIELLEASIKKSNVVGLSCIKTINSGLNKEAAECIKKEGYSKKINRWVVSFATGPCPTREEAPQKDEDLLLYQKTRENPKSLLKDIFSPESLYSVVHSNQGNGSIVFEEKKEHVQRVEKLLKGLTICRIQNGIYAFVHYFSKTNTEENMVLAILDRESCFFLKIESGNWTSISYRKFVSEEELKTIFEEVLAALNPENFPVKWVSSGSIDASSFMDPHPQEQLLEEIVNPIAWSSLYA
jgi:hypothetical protein